MESDFSFSSIETNLDVLPRGERAAYAGQNFWTHVLGLLASHYRTDCTALVSVDHAGFEILHSAGRDCAVACRHLQWAGDLMATLRSAPTGTKATFHTPWMGLRLQCFDPWPAMFLVVDCGSADQFDLPDSSVLYRIEKITSHYLGLS